MRLSVSVARSLCLALAGSALVLTACAQDKPPTLGERLAALGSSHARLAADWEEAEEMKDEAEDDVREATKTIEQAEEDLADAQKRVKKSRQRLAEIEAEAARRGVAVSAPPK